MVSFPTKGRPAMIFILSRLIKSLLEDPDHTIESFLVTFKLKASLPYMLNYKSQVSMGTTVSSFLVHVLQC